MTLKEMMSQRHVVKKYTDQALSLEAQQEVSKRIDDLNQKFNLSMSLKVNDDNGLSSLAKHFMSKNATNYIILASKQKSDEADEALGYAAADLMLYVQSIGLNSWFIGGTYNHKLGQKEQLAVRSIVVIGHGQTNGGPHRSKSLSDVSDYQQKSYPEWYKQGIEAALLAPTAMNRQKFHFAFNDGKPKLTVAPGSFAMIERGLLKYHFELGSGRHLNE